MIRNGFFNLRRSLLQNIAARNRAGSERSFGAMCLRDPTKETMALITLLGMPRDKTLKFIEEILGKLAHFDRIVFVVTCGDLAACTSSGACVEQLPSAGEFANLDRGRDIDAYMTARYAQIQRKWEPDFTFNYGLTPEDYKAQVIRLDLENRVL